MQLLINDRVRIVGDKTKTVYLVCGFNENRGMWLAVEEDGYDGYSGDLIVQEEGKTGTWRVVLCDERSSIRGKIRLRHA